MFTTCISQGAIFHVHTSLQGCSFVLCFTKLFSDRNLSLLQWLLLVRKQLLHVFLLFLYSCLRETFNSNNTLDKSYNKSGALMIDKIYSKQTMIMSNKPWLCQTNHDHVKQTKGLISSMSLYGYTCTCIINLCTFHRHPLQNNNVLHIPRMWVTTVNFPYFLLELITSIKLYLACQSRLSDWPVFWTDLYISLLWN